MRSRTWRTIGAALVMVGLTSCVSHPPGAEKRPLPTPVQPSVPAAPSPVPTPVPEPAPTLGPHEGQTTSFVSVIDGDTVETGAGTVRIIGIDTPERGDCGHDDASAAIGRLLSTGDRVMLELPPGQNDHDRHGRLIRYVMTEANVDLGLMQVELGNAIARYDSTDGYPAHPRQAAYHAAQIASVTADGSVATVSCRTGAPTAATPQGRWWEQYASCTKLKKNTVGHPTGPFARDIPAEAEIYEWFADRTGNNGDGDGDGLACE